MSQYISNKLTNKPKLNELKQEKKIMETVTFKIGGMSCGHCQKRVQDTLMNIDGVSKAVVSLENKEAVVEYDDLKTSADALKKAVADAGYEV